MWKVPLLTVDREPPYHPPMDCRVLLFANLAEDVGERELTLTLAEGAAVSDALEALSEEHEPVRRSLNSLAVAVDGAYSARSEPLRDGCVLALIPPVSGG